MSKFMENKTFEQLNNTLEVDSSGVEDLDPNNDIISHDQMLFVMRVLMFGVTPAVSVIGFVGNVFSIIILLKHGLHKCSNILLICLAATDLTFLVAFNSVPKILYEVVGIEHGYGYKRETSFALFVLYNIFTILDYTTCPVSLTMPMLITVERLVAVYLPFKFNLIITPVRTWCAVIIVYIFWITIIVYMSFWLTFTYTLDAQYNITVGRMERSSLFYHTQSIGKVLDELSTYMCSAIPPVITFVGCIFISIKVTMASRKRKKMTQNNSKESSSYRTTKMLLAVCAVYLVACAVLSMPAYLPQYVQYSLFSDAPSNLSPIIYQVINTAVCINSSANFIVYIVMNKKFRDTYVSLFNICREPRR